MHFLDCAAMCTYSLFFLFEDQDSNDEISLKEFVALPPGEIEYAAQDSDKMWQNEREKEFKEVVDLNSDGKITKDELKVFGLIRHDFCDFCFFSGLHGPQEPDPFTL